MLVVVYDNGERKGFVLGERKELALKFLLWDMPVLMPVAISHQQMGVIRSLWDFLHSDYIQEQFYFKFNDDFSRLMKYEIPQMEDQGRKDDVPSGANQKKPKIREIILE